MKTCAVCDKKLSLFEGKKISGPALICRECMGKVPKMALYSLPHLTAFDVRELIDYETDTVPHLKSMFSETAFYGKLHIDELNGLFAICDKKYVDRTGRLSEAVTDVYRVINLMDISLTVVPDKEQKNRNKVKGSVKLAVALSVPRLFINMTAKEHVYCSCYPVDSTHVGFDEPNDLVFFRNMFNQMLTRTFERYQRVWEEEEEERKKKEQEKRDYMVNEALEYIKAKAAFMVEDGYTEQELKQQRNRLLKTFHPDEGEISVSSYTQDINRYYQILLAHMEENQ